MTRTALSPTQRTMIRRLVITGYAGEGHLNTAKGLVAMFPDLLVIQGQGGTPDRKRKPDWVLLSVEGIDLRAALKARGARF